MKKRALSRASCGLVVLLFIAVVSGCIPVGHFVAVRFEPLSANLQDDKAKVERGQDDIGEGHRTLVVECDDLMVQVSGHVESGPDDTITSGEFYINLDNITGAEVSLKPDSAVLRPKYKEDVPGASANLISDVRQWHEDRPTGAKERQIELSFGGSVPPFEEVVMDFTLVREDTREEYAYRFYLERD